MKVANRFLVIAGVIAAVICSGGLESAAQQQPILGCVISGTGLLRIPAPNEGCKANETPLGFNDLPLLVALKAQVDALQNALIAETAARRAADTAQQSALAAETAARIAAVNSVVEALCAEVDRLPGNPSDAALALCGPLAKRVFVTEAAVSPNLGGLTGADAQCNSLAQTAVFPAFTRPGYPMRRLLRKTGWHILPFRTHVLTVLSSRTISRISLTDHCWRRSISRRTALPSVAEAPPCSRGQGRPQTGRR